MSKSTPTQRTQAIIDGNYSDVVAADDTKAPDLTIVDEANGLTEVLEAAEPTTKDTNTPGFSGAKYKRQLADTNTGNKHTDEQNTCLNALAVHVGFPQAHEAANIFKDISMDVALKMGRGFTTYLEAAEFADTLRGNAFGKGREGILATVGAMLRIEHTRMEEFAARKAQG